MAVHEIEAVPRWTADAERGLQHVLDDEGHIVAAEVNTGRAQLYRLWGDTWLVTRGEVYSDGSSELVVCCMAGRGMHAMSRRVIEAARRQGFDTIRFHSWRKALGRMAARYGFVYAGRDSGGRHTWRMAL